MLGQENSPTIEPWVSERSCKKQIPVRILPPQAWGIIGSQCSLQRSLREYGEIVINFARYSLTTAI
jgi:hypothetical protein